MVPAFFWRACSGMAARCDTLLSGAAGYVADKVRPGHIRLRSYPPDAPGRDPGPTAK